MSPHKQCSHQHFYSSTGWLCPIMWLLISVPLTMRLINLPGLFLGWITGGLLSLPLHPRVCVLTSVEMLLNCLFLFTEEVFVQPLIFICPWSPGFIIQKDFHTLLSLFLQSSLFNIERALHFSIRSCRQYGLFCQEPFTLGSVSNPLDWYWNNAPAAL